MNEFYEHIFDVSFNIPDREISFSPYSIVRFIKRCNYFTDTIPSYTLTCKIEDKYLNILRVYDKEISINIKHIMFYGESRNSMNSRKIIDDLEFACYYDKDKLPNFMNTVKKVDMTNLAVVDTYSENVLGKESPHEITFQLLLKKDLKMKTYIHNYVLGSEENPVTPITAVMTICEQNPYVDKILIDPSDNSTAYCDMIIEPAELKDAIKNIQQIYGLYSKSLELFYDNGMLYILNKYKTDHVFTEDELNVTTCHIVERSDSVDANDSAYISSDLIGYNRKSIVRKEDYESIEGIYTGNKFIYSNYGTVINSMFSKDGETTFISPINEVIRPRFARNDIGQKKIMDYDMLNNAYNMSSYMYERSAGVPLTFIITSMNSEHFAPNKSIKLTFDTPESNKLYSGLYNISNAEFHYESVNQPGRKASTFGHVILRVCNKTNGFDSDYFVPIPEENS